MDVRRIRQHIVRHCVLIHECQPCALIDAQCAERERSRRCGVEREAGGRNRDRRALQRPGRSRRGGRRGRRRDNGSRRIAPPQDKAAATAAGIISRPTRLVSLTLTSLASIYGCRKHTCNPGCQIARTYCNLAGQRRQAACLLARNAPSDLCRGVLRGGHDPIAFRSGTCACAES
jgi:hypothetical protein